VKGMAYLPRAGGSYVLWNSLGTKVAQLAQTKAIYNSTPLLMSSEEKTRNLRKEKAGKTRETNKRSPWQQHVCSMQ